MVSQAHVKANPGETDLAIYGKNAIVRLHVDEFMMETYKNVKSEFHKKVCPLLCRN